MIAETEFMAANIESANFGARVSSVGATIARRATKSDISRLEGKTDTISESLSWQFRWMMVLILLALAASAPDVISLLR